MTSLTVDYFPDHHEAVANNLKRWRGRENEITGDIYRITGICQYLLFCFSNRDSKRLKKPTKKPFQENAKINEKSMTSCFFENMNIWMR
jgi:hypothetical protein